jgi:hypothetical protein
VPAWGWSAHLLLDGDTLVALVGGDGQAVVAFDKATGKEKWKALSTKEICYSPPIVTEAGGKRQLIVWLSEALYSLDPATGAKFWEHKHPDAGEVARPAVSIITPKRAGDKLLISSFYHGTLCLDTRQGEAGGHRRVAVEDVVPEADRGAERGDDQPPREGRARVRHRRDGRANMPGARPPGKVVRSGDEIFGEKAAFCGSVFWVDAGAGGVRADRSGRLGGAEAGPGEV